MLNHRIFIFLKIFFPSWRFFGSADAAPLLLIREKDQEWVNALPSPKTSLLGVIFNPQRGLLHAKYSLLEQALTDLSEWDESKNGPLENTVSYLLVKRMANQSALALKFVTGFQFKIVMFNPKTETTEDYVSSPYYETSDPTLNY